MKRSVINAVLALTVLLVATSAFAVTVSSTNNNNVTATVNGSCRWDTPLTMAFGAYDPFSGAALTQSANISFRCVKLTQATNTYKVWFDKTAGNMTNGSDNLAYTLTDSTATPLPTTAAGAITVVGIAGVGVGAGYTFQVDGAVAAGQDVEVGAYQDTVVANIEY